ncbi:LysM domain - like 10 [Theobroma cacao]|nr:LysM domain - like 10 [Theobroma cacao]WRX34075.1 LysM domain - like 10 [Theobroma cacao]
MGLSLLSHCLYTLMLLSHFHHPSQAQQEYLNNLHLDCSGKTVSISKGYFCNGIQRSCASFLTFRSQPPFDSPESIASLLGSNASYIASINNVSVTHNFSPDKIVVVPTTCSCWGSLFQHIAPYTIRPGDTYFTIANDTYQGLTTCKALDGQNYYGYENLMVGEQLTVPLRCACPSQNQTADGVAFLLTYLVTWGDTLSSIGELFGVDAQSIAAANNVSAEDLIYPFTPLLIPMKSESCSKNPGSLLCSCPNGRYAYELEDGHNCAAQDKRREGFSLKLVTILGVGIGTGFLCLALIGYNMYLRLRKRKDRIRREKFFKQNGGLNLVAYFIASTKENKLLQILDDQIAKEATKEDIYAVAYLAIRCLRLNSKKRPTMKEVSMALEGLRLSHRCLDIHEQAQLISDEISEHTVIEVEEESIFSLDLDSADME